MFERRPLLLKNTATRTNKTMSKWRGYGSLFAAASHPDNNNNDESAQQHQQQHEDEKNPSMELSSPNHDNARQQQNHDNDDENLITVLDIEDAIDRLGMGRFQYEVVFACGLCFASDAMEILLLSFLAVILQSEWGLSEGQVDSIISVVFAGAMLGTLVLSTLGDWWGRRPVFGLTAALISIFGVSTAFCTSYEQIVLARFLVGFGVGGEST
jgi:hypothetical protein